MRLAAIDIGSNAARLLIAEVIHTKDGRPQFNKLNLVRVPLRLGFDVFEKHAISKQKIGMILQTMKAYGHLMKAYEVQFIKACATSAMRDAYNSEDIIRKVKLETGIEIKIISGDEEANLIYENHIAENLDNEHSYFSEGKLKYKESFNIGTIRLLKGQVTEKTWDEMKEHLKRNTKSSLPMIAIGSGGNINKIFSISKKKEGRPLPLDLLKDYYKEFSSFSLDERIRIYKLREDRADVSVPALQIYINVMRWTDIEEIYVPKIGLADGLIQSLYEEVNHIV